MRDTPGKPCRTCKFFRPFRPLSQLLADDLGVQEQELLSELIRMMQDERQQQKSELEQLVELRRTGDAIAWRTQPTMSDYCGFKESDGVFLTHQRQNADGNCSWHKVEEAHECKTCKHRGRVEGPGADKEMIARFRQLAMDAAALGQGGGDENLGNFLRSVGITKAFEATQCYYAHRVTGRRPKYLPVCEKYSAEGSYVPCVVQNPHGRCPGWEPHPGPGAAPQERAIGNSPIVADLVEFELRQRTGK